MPLHHYLPATFLSNFSLDEETIPRRKRMIFVADKKNKNIFSVSTENAGAINNLYTLLDYRKDPEYIDKIWSEYEAKLHITIPRLIVGDLDAKTWIRFLVPFVTCMLVRGPDFDERFNNRITSILGQNKSKKFLSRSNINNARVMEIQRLLFPVASAKWIVIYSPGKEFLLTNDLGYCPFIHPRALDYGLAIPLGKNYVLAISPRKRGQIIRYYGEKWRPIIQYTENRVDTNQDLNRSIVSMAQRFIFSPSYELAEKYLNEDQEKPRPIEPESLGFIDGYQSRAYEFTWHRLAIFLEKEDKPIQQNEEFPLNWRLFFNGWNPPVILPTNLAGFPPPLISSKYSVSFKCYDPDDYYLLNRIMDLERMSHFDEMINEANVGLQNTKNDELRLEFLFSKSIGLYNIGEKEKSSQILDNILEKNPNHNRARLNRTANLLQENELEKAFSDLNFILSNDPNFIEARINLANYYTLKNDFSNAIKEATMAFNLAPEGNLHGLSLIARGVALFSDNKIEDAFEDFSFAVNYVLDKEKKGFGFLYKAITGIHKSKEEMQEISITEKNQLSREERLKDNSLFQKDYDDDNAINDLTHSIELLPESSGFLVIALDMRGELYQKKGLLKLALEDYKKASEADKNNPKFFFKKGEILIEIGNYEQSISENNEVIKLSPHNGGAYNNRGIAKLLTNKIDEAKNDFLQALDLIGDSQGSGSVFRHLAHISLFESKFIKASEYLQKSKQVDSLSPHNLILDSLLKVYNNKTENVLEILENKIVKFDTFYDLKIYLIFPLISLTRIHDALSVFTENIDQVTKSTKDMILMHLKKLECNNSKKHFFHKFLKIINKDLN